MAKLNINSNVTGLKNAYMLHIKRKYMQKYAQKDCIILFYKKNLCEIKKFSTEKL